MANFETINQGKGGSAAAIPVTPAQSWLVALTDQTNVIGSSAYGSPAVHGLNTYIINPITVSGTIAVTQGTSPWIVQDTIAEGYLATIASVVSGGSITVVVSGTVVLGAGTNLIGKVEITDGTNVIGTVTNPFYIQTAAGNDLNVNVDKWGGTSTTLGQKVMASSVPMVVASDQPSGLFSLATSPATPPS